MCYFSTSLLPSTGQGRKGQQTCDRVPVPVCTRHVNVPVVVYQKKKLLFFRERSWCCQRADGVKESFPVVCCGDPWVSQRSIGCGLIWALAERFFSGEDLHFTFVALHCYPEVKRTLPLLPSLTHPYPPTRPPTPLLSPGEGLRTCWCVNGETQRGLSVVTCDTCGHMTWRGHQRAADGRVSDGGR